MLNPSKYLILILKIYLLLLGSVCEARNNYSISALIPASVDSLVPDSANDVVKITRTWELPLTLQKISAIDYLDKDRIVCLQEEVGSIFIYNLDTKTIEKEVPFGPPGDYQGIALVKNHAYVVSSDGRIFEILGYRKDKPHIKEYGTHLSVKEKADGICYDRKNNRLLIAIRGNEEDNQNYKGIYSFSLSRKMMPVKPAILIDLKDEVFSKYQVKKLQAVFLPSDLHINPVNGKLYIVDGERSQMLVMRGSDIQQLMELNKTKFTQPQGICFTPSGELYIANKGSRESPGTLMLVEL